LVLQDIVNELGQRWDFDVENGLYQGKKHGIGRLMRMVSRLNGSSIAGAGSSSLPGRAAGSPAPLDENLEEDGKRKRL